MAERKVVRLFDTAVRLTLGAALLLGLAGFAAVPEAGAGTIGMSPELISYTSGGAAPSTSSDDPSVSDDGRYVAFRSSYGFDGADSEYSDIYVRDRATGDVVWASVPRAGAARAGDSYEPIISDDGQMVAFGSYRDLVPEDTNNDYDLYVRDLVSGDVTLVDFSGGLNWPASFDEYDFSGDGSTVVVETYSSFATEDTDSGKDIYACDVATGLVTWVSEPPVDADEPYRGSRDPSISDDGTLIAFFSGKDFDPADDNSGAYAGQDIYLYDMTAGTYTRADLKGDGSAAGDEVWDIELSGDGTVVLFASDTRYVPEDDIDEYDVYLYDFVAGATEWITQPPVGATERNRGARSATVSDDGRYVALYTGRQLTLSDTNGGQDLYVYDRAAELATCLDTETSLGRDIYDLPIAGDGTMIATAVYQSLSDNDGNSNWDVYALDFPYIVPDPDFYECESDVALTVDAPGVLGNDVSAEPDQFYAVVSEEPLHGMLALEPDGSFTYVPDTDYVGEDSFVYMVTDGYIEAYSRCFIDVVNTAPVAVDDAYEVARNGHLYTAPIGVLENDTDVNGDPLTAVKVTNPAHGSLVLAADGSFTYVPTAGYEGPDSFTYQASDGMDLSSVATVDITVTTTVEPGTLTIGFEDSSAGVTFGRFIGATGAAFSGGGYTYSYSKGVYVGTRLEAKFTGSRVRWIGPKQPSYGMAKVYIDGYYKQTVNCYAAVGTLSAVIYESPVLPEGTHTIWIEMVGGKDPASTGNVVVVDEFEVDGLEPAAGGTRSGELAGTFLGGWVKVAGNAVYTDSSYAYSYWPGARYIKAFTGTRVAWIGPKVNNYGRAAVYIDGVYQATVSQYAVTANTAFRAKVWESQLLPYGTHTIEIRPLGLKEPSSSGTVIVIDGIDVLP